MKKIYTRSVFEFDAKTGRYVVNDNESQYHYVDDDAPVAEMKGGGGKQQVTQTTQPWQPQQPYLKAGYDAAQNAYLGQQPDFSFSPESEEAMNMITARARDGSPINQDATGYLRDELQGKYLYGGAGFDAAYNAASNKIIPQVQSEFARYGRGGSGLASTAETSALGDSFAGLYNQERDRQQNALQYAPHYADVAYDDATKLAAVGMLREQNRNQPIMDKREAAKAFLASVSGQQGTTSTEPGSNMPKWLQVYLASTGGALSGAVAGAPLGPAGMAGGALVGGVSGGASGYYK